MKKLFFLKAMTVALAVSVFTACKNDDTDFSSYTDKTSTSTSTSETPVAEDAIKVIYIAYSGNSVTVSGDDANYVTVNGADVTVAGEIDSLLLVLSGSTADGSLLVNRQKKYGIRLNGVSITNAEGPAINNQCSKYLYLEVAGGTANTLSDGTTYTEQEYDQKGALFSEGEICFYGTGTLNVTGNCKHAIACDDFITIDDALTLNVSSPTGSGIKVNDGLWINNGTIDISVTADAARGIRCDSVVVINGGTTTITTSGDCVYDSEAADYSSAACIKCDHPFTMTGGSLTMTSSGDGGKGINCSSDIILRGGTLVATTTGGNDNGKPKAIKSDTGIIVSGGSFRATVDKSWACDNGYGDDTTSDAEKLANCITVEGSPTTKDIQKKSVTIIYN